MTLNRLALVLGFLTLSTLSFAQTNEPQSCQTLQKQLFQVAMASLQTNQDLNGKRVREAQLYDVRESYLRVIQKDVVDNSLTNMRQKRRVVDALLSAKDCFANLSTADIAELTKSLIGD